MARKLNKNLIALGSAAIVGVYAVGYAHTQPAADHAGAGNVSSAAAAALATLPPSATVTLTPTPAAPSVATAIARAIATASAAAASATPAARTAVPRAPAATAPAGNALAATAQYRDGTFSGYGTSRRGDIEVAVTIESGKITGVQITRSTTYYPIARVARLPGQVVERQSAQVDFVSGATLSSMAFKSAVAQALGQAGAQA